MLCQKINNRMIQNILEENDISYIIEDDLFIIEESFLSDVKNHLKKLKGAQVEFDPTRRKVVVGSMMGARYLLAHPKRREMAKKIFSGVVGDTQSGPNAFVPSAILFNKYADGNETTRKIKNYIKEDLKDLGKNSVNDSMRGLNNTMRYMIKNKEGDLGNQARREFIKKISATSAAAPLTLTQLDYGKVGKRLNNMKTVAKQKAMANLQKRVENPDALNDIEDPSRREFFTKTKRNLSILKRVSDPLAYIEKQAMSKIASSFA